MCDPPLDALYTVNFAGLAGSFAPYDGTNYVEWESYCDWFTADRKVKMYWGGSFWVVVLRVGDLCVKEWKGGTDPCDPRGVYVEYQCFDHLCSDPLSCYKSSGTTCEVTD